MNTWYLSLVSSEVSEGFCVESDFASVAALDLTSAGAFSASLTTVVLEGVWPVALVVTWVVEGALSEVLSSGGEVWGYSNKIDIQELLYFLQ